MANNDDNHCNEISQNAQKTVLAEDLVNYILQKYSVPSILFSTERQRKSCVSIFDENLRMAADIFNNTVEDQTDEICQFILQNNWNTIPSFHHFAHTLRKNFLTSSLYTESFFHYSVYLAQVAAKLYVQQLKEAPRIALHYIIDAMDFDRFISRRAVLDGVAQNYADYTRRFCMVQQPPPYRKDKSVVQAIKVQICTTHEDLNPCEVTTKNIHGDVFDKDKMKEDITTLPSSFNSETHSEFEKNQAFVFDHPYTNAYNEPSQGFIGVPGSSRGDPTNIYSQECYTVDSSSEDEIKQENESHSGFEKNQTLVFDHPKTNPYNESSSDYIIVPRSTRSDPTNIFSQECYFVDSSSEDENKQPKKPRLEPDL